MKKNEYCGVYFHHEFNCLALTYAWLKKLNFHIWYEYVYLCLQPLRHHEDINDGLAIISALQTLVNRVNREPFILVWWTRLTV